MKVVDTVRTKKQLSAAEYSQQALIHFRDKLYRHPDMDHSYIKQDLDRVLYDAETYVKEAEDHINNQYGAVIRERYSEVKQDV